MPKCRIYLEPSRSLGWSAAWLASAAKRFWLLVVGLLVAACISPIQMPAPNWIEQFEQADDGYGVGDPARWVIGGGEGYGAWVERRSVTVATKDELLAALQQSQPGDVIYVEDSAEIDLTGTWDTRIPAGVTLASGRGRNGSAGALIYTTQELNRTLFDIRAGGVRITGLRLRGPSTRVKPGGCPLNAHGITVRVPPEEKQQPVTGNEGMNDSATDDNATDDNATDKVIDNIIEIDNNELWAWPFNAIHVIGTENVYIHHNHIHHNRRIATSLEQDPEMGCSEGAFGLGYGVNVTGAHVYIDANLFDHNRHDIASDGSMNSGYTARYNLIMPDDLTDDLPEGVSHSFDMHGFGEQRQYGLEPPYEAGNKMVIHHNTFLLESKSAIVIRGIPREGAWIYQNQFVGPRTTIMQRYVDATGKSKTWPDTVKLFEVPDNKFSVDVATILTSGVTISGTVGEGR